MEYRYSVIIPVYNAAGTLPRCLDSLLCQTQGRAELILINDGSKDESLQICRSYERMHPEVKVLDQENAGASSARNAGLDTASGKYITFVDSDDFVPDDYFDNLDKAGDVDFAVFPYFRVAGNETIPFPLPQSVLRADNHSDRVIEVIRHMLASPWNKRYKKEIIDENQLRFKRDLIIGEDFLFGLSYMLCCKTSCASECMIYYVDESSTASITRSSRYPTSQYSMIYEYAFPLVFACSWDEENRTQLLQQIDYLFCRTAFVAAVRLRRMEKRDCTLDELIQRFHDGSYWTIHPSGAIHALMKFCIKRRIKPVFAAVSCFIASRRN